MSHRWVTEYQAGSTVAEIAERHDAPVSRVRMTLAGAGVTSKRPRTPGGGRPRSCSDQEIADWLQRRVEGASIAEVARAVGRAPGTIHRYTRRAAQ